MTPPIRRIAMLSLAALLVLAGGAYADTAKPAAPAAPWWVIAQALTAYGIATPGTPEIQPEFVSPEDQSHTLAFRGAVPNPFHSETAIRFKLPTSAHVTLRLYDVAGKLVRTLVDAQLPAGEHSAMLVAGDMRSGVYFAVLRCGVVTTSRSVVLAR